MNYFFPKFCEPPNRRIDSIKSSCDGMEFLFNRLSLSFDCSASLRIVIVFVVVVCSPPLPIRRTVRYSVIVLPNGFGARIGGGGAGGGEVRVITCLRSLSTVT
jgi:hypothetical protein